VTPELSRLLPLTRIGPNGLDQRVEATAAECAALAERMQLPAVHTLTCDFQLRRPDETTVLARARLSARVVQTCVVSAEDFEVEVTEDFRVRFVPAGEETEELDPDADDEIPYEGTSIDLGEAAAEQLGLALDPYPRMPGAGLPEPEPEEEPHPFAALSALRGRQP
jgi:uncharacterized metal-binding protein YceD (DUF177 family)